MLKIKKNYTKIKKNKITKKKRENTFLKYKKIKHYNIK